MACDLCASSGAAGHDRHNSFISRNTGIMKIDLSFSNLIPCCTGRFMTLHASGAACFVISFIESFAGALPFDHFKHFC
jgi:hypothetical protein